MPFATGSDTIELLYQPTHPPNSPTYTLLQHRIPTLLLKHHSAYFTHLLSTDPNTTTHILTGPPVLFRSYQILLSYIAALPSGDAKLNLMNRTYTSLALLYQAARVLGLGVVEARLLRRLRMCDLEVGEVEELIRAVGVRDVSVAFVIGHLAEASRIKGESRVEEVVRRVSVEWPEFGVMFENEVRRRGGRDRSRVSWCTSM